jgi:hypothetical protein
MARRSLRPHFNQIRLWVQQGRTDAWIAHQLEVTVQQIETFKRENDLSTDAESVEPNGSAPDFDDEIDLRAEDDARIAAELEAEAAARAEAEAKAAAEEAERAAEREAARAARAAAGEDEEDEEEDDDDDKPKRRRGRRGGRGRARKSTGPLEATFDHGDEGYGLWLDPAVADDATYAEHWAGHRAVEVIVEIDQIIIRRVGDDAGEAEGDSEE